VFERHRGTEDEGRGGAIGRSACVHQRSQSLFMSPRSQFFYKVGWTSVWAALFYAAVCVFKAHGQPLAEGTRKLAWVVVVLLMTAYGSIPVAARSQRWAAGSRLQSVLSTMMTLSLIAALFLQWLMLARKIGTGRPG